MHVQRMLKNFNRTAQRWEAALQHYSETQLLQQPDSGSWSIGQVYIHLIEGSLHFHLKQVEACLASEQHTAESKNIPGKLAYLINGFPPIRIKVPPSPEYTPRQPVSKESILLGLQNLKEEMHKKAQALATARRTGKTKHSAFGYLCAEEWYQLIDMHFRHHFRQKKRIDQFLIVHT